MGCYKENKQAQQGSMFFWCNWGKIGVIYLETFQNTISNVILDEIKMDFGLNLIQNVIHGVH
jgi:hypothetical protein